MREIKMLAERVLEENKILLIHAKDIEKLAEAVLVMHVALLNQVYLDDMHGYCKDALADVEKIASEK